MQALRALHAHPGAPTKIELRFVASAAVRDYLARRLRRMRDGLTVAVHAGVELDKP